MTNDAQAAAAEMKERAAKVALGAALEYLRGQSTDLTSGGHRNGELRDRIKVALLGGGTPLRQRSEIPDVWRLPEMAPKDGTMLRLLVDYSEGGAPLEDALVTWTIGFNNFDDTGEDVWQFSGWDWCHDRFTQGTGKVIGWLTLPPVPSLREARNDAGT